LAESLQRELARRHGVALADLNAMHTLARLGEVPISRYCANLGVPNSTATHVVDRLESAGFLERRLASTDRRVTLVSLTPAGLQAIEDTEFILRSELVTSVLAMGPEERTRLAQLLERLVGGSAAAASVGESRRPEVPKDIAQDHE